MGKWALWAVTGFLGCSLSVSAQTTRQGDLLALNQSRMVGERGLDLSSLNSAHYGFPWLTIADGRILSLSSGYNWIEPMPVDFLPDESVEIPTRARKAASSELDSGDKTVEVKPKLIDYVHGEVGVLYGTSAGSKFGREVEQGYILGEIGNDKYQINVGAFYEHSNAHFPRH